MKLNTSDFHFNLKSLFKVMFFFRLKFELIEKYVPLVCDTKIKKKKNHKKCDEIKMVLLDIFTVIE